MNTGEQLREMQNAFAEPLMKRIKELEAELAALKAKEPIGWYTDDHLTDKSATTYDRAIAERWDEKGWPLWPLYASPAQPLTMAEVNDQFCDGNCTWLDHHPDCVRNGSAQPQSDGVMVPRELLLIATQGIESVAAHFGSFQNEVAKKLRALLGGEA